MSLLANVNQPTTGQYYFALDTTPDTAVVTAQAFVATGGAEVGPVGTVSVRGDAVPGGIDMFNIQKANGTTQWSIGLGDVPAGANVGNDIFFYAYDDNGAFLSAPMSIQRSNGIANLALGLNVGQATTAGGAPLNIFGTAGLSRVFDGIYNRPVPGPEVVLSTFNNVGAPTGPLVPYTPTNSGLFTLTMEVRVDSAGYAWTNGTDVISGYLANVAPPFALLSDSFTTCDSLANPGGAFGYPSGFPMGVYVKDIVAVINLTAGVTYQPTISIGGAFNLGATGGVRFFIQPLLA